VQYAKSFDGKSRVAVKNGKKHKMDTQEGDIPVLELIEFLKVQKPMEPLKLAADLKPYACKHN
jgi:hypothetical protein